MEKLMDQIKRILGIGAVEAIEPGGNKGGDNDAKSTKGRAGSGGPVWKRLNTLMLVGSAGVLLIVLANLFTPGDDLKQTTDSTQTSKSAENPSNIRSSKDISGLENDIAQKLEGILGQINGVGEVKVTVNLASTPEKDFAVNSSVDTKSTQERDQRGGNRSITETNEQDQMVLVRESQGTKEDPVVVKEKKPEVKGVVVVADGVGDPVVKADVMNATQVFLDIPLYRVIVLEKESR